MNPKELIQLANNTIESVELKNIQGKEAAFLAKETLQNIGDIPRQTIHQLISLCCIDPGMVSGIANPRFGEPSIIVSETENWVFEIISWRNMVTAIHEHSYYGAFKALSGRRLHFDFLFVDETDFSDDRSLKIGELKCNKVELLKGGDTHTIFKEREFIHSLWPIDLEAYTIVFRQKGPSNSWSYLPNKLTYDERLCERYLGTRLRYLRELRKYDEKMYVSTIETLFKSSPFAVLVYLVMALQISVDSEIYDRVNSICNYRNKSFSDALRESAKIDEIFRESYKLRPVTTCPEQNHKLAVLFYSSFLPPDLAKELNSIEIQA